MKRREQVQKQRRWIAFFVIALAVIASLLLYKLGSLTGGLSSGELQTAHAAYGWHGIYHNPFDLPLKLVQSIIFFVWRDHGQSLSRLPETLFGALTIIVFTALIKLWHGNRMAILTGVLFACGAWTLHISRLASPDVLYLWGTVMLVASNVTAERWIEKPAIYYGVLLLWGLMLYIPGFIWFILLNIWWSHGALIDGWKQFSRPWQRALAVLSVLIWLPLLLIQLTRSGMLKAWLGLPAHFPSLVHLGKQFVGVGVHLFIRGPEYPQLWLARAPLLDAFSLVLCLIGIYFYAKRWKAYRSQLFASIFVVGYLLVSLGGAVSLSVLVPLLYMVMATGIAYLLHEWQRVFPHNPIARGVGIGLITLAVLVSCWYNLRAYFVAWPHNAITETTFVYHLRR